MRPIEGVVDIERPPQAVFDYISDVRHLPQWQPDVHDAALSGDGAAALGAPGRAERRVGGSLRTIHWVVSDYVPGQCWGVRGTDGPVRAHVRMDISALAEGRASRLHYLIDPAGHGAGTLLALVSRAGIRRGVPGNLRRLKERLEGAG